jgi:hypothetical protein
MTVSQFKGYITSLFSQEHYDKNRAFYMQIYAAAYKSGTLGEVYEIIDDIKYFFANPKINVKNPAAWFAHFINEGAE